MAKLLKKLKTFIFAIFAIVVGLVTSTVFIVILLLFLPSRLLRIKVTGYYGKILGRSIIFLLRTKPVVVGKEKLQENFPAIYMANHTSSLDFFSAVWLCPIGGVGVAKKEVALIPFIGWVFWLSGHLLIDRGNREKAVASLENVARLVKKYNLGIWMWPEGTRSKDGCLQNFKKGFVHLAINTRLPLQPIIIHNAHKKWKKHEGIDFTSMDLNIEVLDAIDTSNWQTETLEEHLKQVWEVFYNHLGEEQKPEKL